MTTASFSSFSSFSSSYMSLNRTSPSVISNRVQMITQTYSLAHTARRKLAREASRPDLRLSRLVGHANLLDSLMLELGLAEREQQHVHLPPRTLNDSVGRREKDDTSRHVQWVDCTTVESDRSWSVSDFKIEGESSSNKSQRGEEISSQVEGDANFISLQRVSSHSHLLTLDPINSLTFLSQPDISDDDQESSSDVQLEFSSPSVPPELDHDSDSSEDESIPAPPSENRPSSMFESDLTTSSFPKAYLSDDLSLSRPPVILDKGYYLPQPTDDALASPISVY